MRTTNSILATLVGFGCIAVAHADGSCQSALDAMQKLARTPVHQYIHTTAAYAKAPTDAEVVVTADHMYALAAAKWHAMPYDPQQRAQEVRDSEAAKRTACRYLRDEAVGGQAAAVYATHDDQGEGASVDNTLWISKSSGLPLRQTTDVDIGGRLGKSHSEIRFDYADVKAPEGAK